jgi:F-type H+-transporting ATPase subunit delta
MPLVAKRYAQAFFELCEKKGALDGAEQDLKAVCEAYGQSRELREFLQSPQNGSDLKKQALRALFSARVGLDTLHFLLLLIDKNRIGHLPEIWREFAATAGARRHVLNITITSAVPLDQRCVDAVCEKFRTLFGCAKVVAEVETDPSLIGGVRVTAGGRLFDGSIKGRSLRLQSLLGI